MKTWKMRIAIFEAKSTASTENWLEQGLLARQTLNSSRKISLINQLNQLNQLDSSLLKSATNNDRPK